jgi:hypothetical protein
MAEAICGIFATVCMDICAGVCLDFASTRQILTFMISHLTLILLPQATDVQNTFALVRVVDA